MIKVHNLAKAFGAKRAVDGISFSVERGEVLGFLGPNGAGKSTTMRMITGFIPPTEGTVSVGGLTFTAGNWNAPQTVTIIGVDDALDDNDVSYTIVTATATSLDLAYNGLNASDVSVTNTDDESGAAGLTFGADGGQLSYGFYPTDGRLRLTRFDGPGVDHWSILKETRSERYRPGTWIA